MSAVQLHKCSKAVKKQKRKNSGISINDCPSTFISLYSLAKKSKSLHKYMSKNICVCVATRANKKHQKRSNLGLYS